MWSVVAGSLPQGIELRTNLHEIVGSAGPSLAYLFGRATAVGPVSFTLQVEDAMGAMTTRAFAWNVSALNIEYRGFPQPGAPLIYNQSYTQAALGIGGTSSYTWTSETSLPVGLSIDPNTGIISGTPLNTGSSFTTLRLDDNAGNSMRASVSFFVSSGTPQAISFNDGPSLVTTPRGALYTLSLSFFGGTAPYSLTLLSPLPPGMALLTGEAVTSGNIGSTYQLVGAPLQSGPFSFTLRVQDSSAPTANVGVRTFTLVVSGTSILSSSSLFDGSLGVPYSQELLAANDNLPTTWSALSGMPPGLTLTPAGLLTGVPTQAGTFSINAAATDAAGAQATRSFSLRIATIAIAGSDILPIATTGTPYTHAFALAGGGTAVWTTVGLGFPTGMTFSSAGVVSGTASSAGMFQITVQATSGTAVVTKRVSMYVVLPNPSLLTFSIAATQLPDRWTGEAFTFNFGGSNGTPPYTWTVADGSALPPGLSLQSGSTAALIAGPGNTILTGAVSAPGIYSFVLIATDAAGQTMRRTFTLTVSSIALVSTTIRSVTVG
ncbi:MAG: putative Ig domain-containing protein, partial [Acidobacteriota bacterium]|nr:putative Ig domain-containing protein [Acidobacteriota bacterium]